MLMLGTEQIALWLGSFFWPFVRISSMMMAAPVFGARMMPVRIRIMLALSVSVLTVPLLPPVPAVDPISFAAAGILFQQILICVATGLIIQMVFQFPLPTCISRTIASYASLQPIALLVW